MERFVDKLVNLFVLDKPESGTAKEWHEWENNARLNQPVAYWIDDTLIPFVKRNTITRLNDIRSYIRYRIFDKYHLIHTGLKPGYQDCDTRLLHGMFNLLVDFVEIEKAWMHVVFDDEAMKKYNHPWWSFGWTRFKAFRDPQAGLAHLEWEMSLDSPNLSEYERSDNQAQTAREIAVLYDWWKNIRPQRPDVYEASGWSAICARKREKSGSTWAFLDSENETSEEREEINRALDENRRIEQSYDREDEEMLIRLIKIRKGLWT